MKKKTYLLLCLTVMMLLLAGCGKREKLTKEGIRQLQAGDYISAESSFKSALSENGWIDTSILSGTQEIDILKYLAEAQVGLEEYSSAQATYEQILAKKENDNDARYYLGQCKEFLGDYAGAIEVYKEQLKQDASYIKSYVRIALCYIEQNDGEHALEAAQNGLQAVKAMDQSKTGEQVQQLQYLEAVSYEYMQDYATALSKMKDYVQTYPDDEKAQKEYTFLLSR